jgi:hypothetical protein
VILEFVARQPKCEAEEYDYRLERYGIISAELAPQYWIWRPESLVKGQCRKVLAALLSQLAASALTKSPITDLHQVCAKIEGEFSRFRGDDRKACAAIYVLFNCYLPLDQRRANYETFHKRCAKALKDPSIEALCLHLILGSVPSWSADDQRGTLDSYFEKRNQKGGLRVPELFEAGMLLSLAERYRSGGQLDQARTLLAFATVNAVHFPALVSVQAQFDPDRPIDWRALLPGSPPNSSDGEAAGAEPSPQTGKSEVKGKEISAT